MNPGDTINNYKLEKCIGIGGVGEVWRARHLALDKQVAIKRILPHLCGDTGFQERFAQEALAMANLEHPNIVGIHDYFTKGDEPYIVMSYIRGGSLRDRLGQSDKLTLQEILQIAGGILDALDFAHRHGVVHRDVKPSNILLSTESHPYLVDFGIALILGKPRLTKFGNNIGTPEYMSPEQIRSKPLDHSTDVYSMGCVLYEMLAGHPPFGSTDDDESNDFKIMERHIKERPEALRLRRSEADPRLEAIVMRALAKDKHDRFSGCAQMASELPPLGGTRSGSSGVAAAGARPLIWKIAAGALAMSTLIAAAGWYQTSRQSPSGDLARMKSKITAMQRENQECLNETDELHTALQSLQDTPPPRKSVLEIIKGEDN